MTLPAHNGPRFSANAPICSLCVFHTGGICSKDSVPIHLHADVGYCPESLLPAKGEKPDGWEELKGEPSAAQLAPEVTPEQWGPSLWLALEQWASECDLQTARSTIHDFTPRIPCGPCRQHWEGLLAAHPPDASSRAAIIRWLVDRHNDVNRLLGKPIWSPSTPA